MSRLEEIKQQIERVATDPNNTASWEHLLVLQEELDPETQCSLRKEGYHVWAFEGQGKTHIRW